MTTKPKILARLLVPHGPSMWAVFNEHTPLVGHRFDCVILVDAEVAASAWWQHEAELHVMPDAPIFTVDELLEAAGRG